MHNKMVGTKEAILNPQLFHLAPYSMVSKSIFTVKHFICLQYLL